MALIEIPTFVVEDRQPKGFDGTCPGQVRLATLFKSKIISQSQKGEGAKVEIIRLLALTDLYWFNL